MEGMRKGIFWFICSFNENDECDFSVAEMISALIPVDNGSVEIRNHKAVVFMNPNILECPQYKEMIAGKFCLREIRMKVMVDNSVHYNCHADNISIR